MTPVLANLSDPTVLVALVTGATTAISTITASALTSRRSLKAEDARAGHALDTERARWEREDTRKEREEADDLVTAVTESVLRFGMTARWARHIQLAGPSRPGREGLADLQLPEDALRAVAAVERLRSTLPEQERAAAEELRDEIDRVFDLVTSGRGEGGPAELKKGLDARLRRLTDTLSTGKQVSPAVSEEGR